MGSRRLRISVAAGFCFAALIAAASLVSGTMSPVLEVAGAIPSGVIAGVVFYVMLPAFTSRR
jgi:hypothetical protein